MDYKNGMKGNWRRTIHNRIVDLLAVKPSEAVVLYLAGIQDLDRAEFLRRGFKSNNLICVEKHKRTASEIRSNRKLCIESELGQVISACRRFPVHVVLGDFCCGLELSVVSLIDQMIENPCFNGSVVVFNVMRGRDPNSKQFRALFPETKHRGQMLGRFYVSRLREWMKDLDGGIEPNRDLFDNFATAGQSIILDQIVANCWTGSYISPSGQYFDSCAFRNLTPQGISDLTNCYATLRLVESEMRTQTKRDIEQEKLKRGLRTLLDPEEVEFHATNLDGLLEPVVKEAMANARKDIIAKAVANSWADREVREQKVDLDNPVSRQFAAIKATRTMRINGTLPA